METLSPHSSVPLRLQVNGRSPGRGAASLAARLIAHDAFQCGYCTPGQLMSLKALFDANPVPDDEALRQALSGNLCRCGAYSHILKAARAAAGGRGHD